MTRSGRFRRPWALLVLTILMSALLFAMSGCAPAPARESTVVPQQPPVLATVVVEKAVDQAAGYRGAASELGSLTDRMIIRTGDMAIVVEDTAAAMRDVQSIAEEMGGYVVDSNAYRAGEVLHGSMTVRVPAERFDPARDRIRALAVRVERETTSGQDVTEEYTDLQARLRNLEATEAELRELLTTVRERTNKAEDILAVYRELTTIRGEIESLKGRMQYLERMTAMATIHVELIPHELSKPVAEEPWSPAVTLRNAERALVSVGRTIVDILIWFVIVGLPVLVIIALVVFLIRTLRRRSRRRREKPTPPPAPPAG